MTAHAMAGDREKSLQAGMNDHVTKPIDKKALFAALMKWMHPLDRSVTRAPELVRESRTPDAASALPALLPGINVAEALERLGGNRRLYRSLLTQFGRDYGEVTARVGEALTGDLGDGQQTASAIIHTVRGVAGNLSATRLFDTALRLEQSINDGNRDAWPARLQTFDDALEEVLASIEAIERRPVSITANEDGERRVGEGTPVDRETMVALLVALSEDLRETNANALDVFETLKPLLATGGEEVSEAVGRLESHLGCFDFDEALVALGPLAEVLEVDLGGGAG